MKKILKAFTVALFISASAFADPAIGEWSTHFSYKTANQVVLGDDNVYVEANGKLFSYGISDEKLQLYTKLTGLNDHTVSFIGWSSTQKMLIVVYSNGNIDILSKSGIFNVPDYKNKSLTGDKTIYGLRVVGNEAFLSTGIGLIVLDIAKKEFSDNYYLGKASSYTKCLDATVWQDSIMVATANGLFLGHRSDNLQDFSFWNSVPFESGLTVKKILRFENQFFALSDNGVLYQGNFGSWHIFVNNAGITDILVQDSALFAVAGVTTYMFDRKLNRMEVDAGQDNSVAWDSKSKTLYMASGLSGLSIFKYNQGIYSSVNKHIIPEGPSSNTAWSAFFQDGVYYATAGARWGDRNFYDGEILVNDGSWHGLSNKKAMIDSIGYRPLDFTNMAVDPMDDTHYFVTTWGDGLLEFKNNEFYKQYGPKNSPLRNIISGRFCRVDGAIFDEKGNLWVLNSKYYAIGPPTTKDLPDSALCILKPDGTWFQPFYPELMTAPTWNSILFTSQGQIWMNAVRERFGVFILDNNGTIFNTSDDQCRLFDSFTDTEGNKLNVFTVCCMVEDKNGTIWLGTNLGPLLANGVSSIFNKDYTFARVKIPRNDGTDLADYLLDNVQVNCMTVDGANRKWVGTKGNGIYLLSSDGLKTIHHFTTQNSPLPSDNLWSIAINPQTGEVFMGTDAGLISYRSDATEGSTNYNDIHVFPNPVRPDYNGQITVTGLMEKTQVRITDLNGNAVISGTSLGGQFSWNGILKSGKKASSGVYLVFCASEDGSEYQACKFMIVR